VAGAGIVGRLEFRIGTHSVEHTFALKKMETISKRYLLGGAKAARHLSNCLAESRNTFESDGSTHDESAIDGNALVSGSGVSRVALACDAGRDTAGGVGNGRSETRSTSAGGSRIKWAKSASASSLSRLCSSSKSVGVLDWR
jgi:hypothetical protein